MNERPRTPAPEGVPRSPEIRAVVDSATGAQPMQADALAAPRS
jgi:hypothetical protein